MIEFNIYAKEEELQDAGLEKICGIDEAGRGALAGPIAVAAVIMPPFVRLPGINDSKQLSDKKRRVLYKQIMKQALAVSVVLVSEKDVDDLNVYQATKKGMLEAVKKLKLKPDYILIDAMPLNELDTKHESIIHGDARSASIAAASIVAKVTRDDYMIKMDIKYPNYGFAKHKGYCTKLHMTNLEANGPCQIHRKTFYPVSTYYVRDRQLAFDFDAKEE